MPPKIYMDDLVMDEVVLQKPASQDLLGAMVHDESETRFAVYDFF